MHIQVLGSGCPTCKKLYEITQQATSEMGVDTSVEYVTGAEGMQKIIELGAMSSPLLVIDGEIAMTGFTPDVEKIKEKIQAHAQGK
jgi:small redox-active disulfide protein 2